MKIAVVGTGYVGLVTGTCFAETGNRVTCVDIDPNKINKLAAGEITIYEPGLEKIFLRNLREGRLQFTTDLKEGVADAEIIFLALPTPPGEYGSADLRYVLGVAADLGKLLKDYKVIVDKSTVPVGTAEKVQAAVAAHYSGEFDVVSNPEFLREGVAVEDFMKPDRVVIGTQSERARKVMNDLYAPFDNIEINPSSQNKSNKRFLDAISEGLKQSMEKFPELILMGQDIAEYGGAFKMTEGFVEKFGKDRVRNTTLCESAIVGTSLGLSIKGMKAMVEMQFADFVTCGFNQIINNLAKIHYRWGQNADVVVRMPTGAGVGAGPFHSQSNEAWFVHTPGLKVLYPAFPNDAKGLMCAAFNDPNPILFFEHKGLYRSITEDVYNDYFTIEIGKANLVRTGKNVSIITYGAGVHWAMEILDKHPQISADLVDLRTLLPYDKEAILESVKKTSRAIVLHEDTLIGGIGGEISAFIMESCFEYLDAPVVRSASLDTPVPFNLDLEQNFLPKKRFEEQLLQLLKY
jgi:2-oxoisovalerate dehydrogenase E1 component